MHLYEWKPLTQRDTLKGFSDKRSPSVKYFSHYTAEQLHDFGEVVSEQESKFENVYVNELHLLQL